MNLLNHKVVNQVLETRDYALFNKLLGNRKSVVANVNNLRKSFNKHYIAYPILVNENFEIIEGQNRFDAAVADNRQIYYITIEGLTLDDVHLLNEVRSGWDDESWLDSNCSLGIEDYFDFKRIQDYAEHKDKKILISTLLWIFNFEMAKKISMDEFKAGGFVFINEAWIREILDSIKAVSRYYKGWYKPSFVKAMVMALTTYEFDLSYFLKQLSKGDVNRTINDQSKIEDFVGEIQKVYNYTNRVGKIRLTKI